MFENNSDIIKPLLLVSPDQPSKMRKHCNELAKDLSNKVRKRLPDSSKTLFVFVLRGAMFLYPAFVNEFEDASFCFTHKDYVTKLECVQFETVVIVDTLVNSGNVISNVKKLILKTVNTKKLYLAVVFSNKNVKENLCENFDEVFCLLYMDTVSILVDVGAAFTNGNGIDKPKNYLIHQ